MQCWLKVKCIIHASCLVGSAVFMLLFLALGSLFLLPVTTAGKSSYVRKTHSCGQAYFQCLVAMAIGIYFNACGRIAESLLTIDACLFIMIIQPSNACSDQVKHNSIHTHNQEQAVRAEADIAACTNRVQLPRL